MTDTRLDFIEQDDEFMYFRVFQCGEIRGVVYIGKVKGLRELKNVNEGNKIDANALREAHDTFQKPHKKIQKCCPDMNLAIDEGFIKVVSRLPYIFHGESDWDLDFCPFCGKEIVLIQSSTPTAKEGVTDE